MLNAQDIYQKHRCFPPIIRTGTYLSGEDADMIGDGVGRRYEWIHRRVDNHPKVEYTTGIENVLPVVCHDRPQKWRLRCGLP